MIQHTTPERIPSQDKVNVFVLLDLLEKNSLLSLDRFDKKRKAQLLKVFESFYSSPKTMMECEVETGVMRSNICWYKQNLIKASLISVIDKRNCTITKHKATVLTTNPALFPNTPQMRIFESVTISKSGTL